MYYIYIYGLYITLQNIIYLYNYFISVLIIYMIIIILRSKNNII